MKRMLFTIPDGTAKKLQDLVPEGERSQFVVQHIQIPLEVLHKYKKSKKKTPSPYKPSFIRAIKKAEESARQGKIFTQEEVMKHFGLL